MSEPKLCPFRKYDAPRHERHDLYDLFAPCLGDKCAMWREVYCGLAGEWPIITRGPNPNVKAPDLVVIQEGLSPSKRRP